MGMRQEQSSAAAPEFWVVVEDHQVSVFGVFGPVGEDVEWTTRISLARERDWDVTICTVASEEDARELALKLIEHGFEESELKILRRLGPALAERRAH